MIVLEFAHLIQILTESVILMKLDVQIPLLATMTLHLRSTMVLATSVLVAEVILAD
jgi:hypothetical protein